MRDARPAASTSRARPVGGYKADAIRRHSARRAGHPPRNGRLGWNTRNRWRVRSTSVDASGCAKGYFPSVPGAYTDVATVHASAPRQTMPRRFRISPTTNRSTSSMCVRRGRDWNPGRVPLVDWSFFIRWASRGAVETGHGEHFREFCDSLVRLPAHGIPTTFTMSPRIRLAHVNSIPDHVDWRSVLRKQENISVPVAEERLRAIELRLLRPQLVDARIARVAELPDPVGQGRCGQHWGRQHTEPSLPRHGRLPRLHPTRRSEPPDISAPTVHDRRD